MRVDTATVAVPEGRSPIHASVRDTSKAAWETLSALTGASVTGILDAMGEVLEAELAAGRDPAKIRWKWDEVFAHARMLDAERRRRSGR